MEKQVTMSAGECELATKLATKAIAEGELRKPEERAAQNLREKIVTSSKVQTLEQ